MEKYRIYEAENKQMIERLIYPKFTAEITFNSDVSDLENIQVDEDIFDAMVLATAMRETAEFILESVFSARAKESKSEKISHFRSTGEKVLISEPSEKTIKTIAKIADVKE